jgi:multidrug resistance efflux pump
MRWKTLVAGGALLAAILVTLGFWPLRLRRESLQLPGVVEIQEVRLGSKIGGRVAAVLVNEGDIVQPDQPLVRIDVPELEAQKIQWEARLKQMEADLEKQKNGSRAEEIAQAKSDLASAQADLVLARADFARSERLIRQGGTDRAEYDSARAALDRCQGRCGSLRSKLDLFLAGTRHEEIAEAEGRVAETRGRIRELDANLNEATVRAPEKAVVEVMGVRKGDLILPNQPIVRILRADDLWVRVYVPETQLGKVVLGQHARVTIDSYPGREFDGVVVKIDSESEFTPRNVQSVDERRFQVFGVKIRVADPQGIFKSGMAANVVFDVAK